MTEADEHGPGGFTPIVEGDWKVNVHPQDGLKTLGFRRYHKHNDNWYHVVPVKHVGSDGYDVDVNDLQCSNCGEPVPAEMEGYIKLARWSTNAN